MNSFNLISFVLTSLFACLLQSRYPPDTEVVDKLMMSKMDHMMKLIRQFDDKKTA